MAYLQNRKSRQCHVLRLSLFELLPLLSQSFCLEDLEVVEHFRHTIPLSGQLAPLKGLSYRVKLDLRLVSTGHLRLKMGYYTKANRFTYIFNYFQVLFFFYLTR